MKKFLVVGLVIMGALVLGLKVKPMMDILELGSIQSFIF